MHQQNQSNHTATKDHHVAVTADVAAAVVQMLELAVEYFMKYQPQT